MPQANPAQRDEPARPGRRWFQFSLRTLLTAYSRRAAMFLMAGMLLPFVEKQLLPVAVAEGPPPLKSIESLSIDSFGGVISVRCADIDKFVATHGSRWWITGLSDGRSLSAVLPKVLEDSTQQQQGELDVRIKDLFYSVYCRRNKLPRDKAIGLTTSHETRDKLIRAAIEEITCAQGQVPRKVRRGR